MCTNFLQQPVVSGFGGGPDDCHNMVLGQTDVSGACVLEGLQRLFHVSCLAESDDDTGESFCRQRELREAHRVQCLLEALLVPVQLSPFKKTQSLMPPNLN